jgi:hypothetical protein
MPGAPRSQRSDGRAFWPSKASGVLPQPRHLNEARPPEWSVFVAAEHRVLLLSVAAVRGVLDTGRIRRRDHFDTIAAPAMPTRAGIEANTRSADGSHCS